MAGKDLINKELVTAVGARNFERVKVLLSEGADINHTEQWERNSLLHLSKNAEISKELNYYEALVFM